LATIKNKATIADCGDYIVKRGHKYFKSNCITCGGDRGYKRKVHIHRSCGSCVAKKNFSTSKHNPMFGKKHTDRERFRKHTHKNVNYDDRRIVFSKSGNKRLLYRTSCLQCGADRGYKLHIDATRVCKACRASNSKMHTQQQKKIRCAMKANLVARLKNRLMNKNKKSTFDVLGYTVDELMRHLEAQFQPGMTWDNYGRYGWHIDHVTPDSWFRYNSTEDEGFKKSWALENLQPLWECDNLSKSNRRSG
jgi:hypothetical protein